MEELIRQCQQGDRESMGRLYTVMHDELLAHCRKYAANDTASEDLLHDAFLLIFSNIDKLRSPEKGVRWMHKVVRNVCLVYMQHRQSLTSLPADEVRETVQSPESDAALTYDDILSAIDQLPSGYRQVFRLSVLEGLTHQQIAELLGIEPHTSSSQLLRAKRQLRKMLQVLVLLLATAIPFGGYYYWTLRGGRHEAAVAADHQDTPKGIGETAKEHADDNRVGDVQVADNRVASVRVDSVRRDETASLQTTAVAVADTSVGRPVPETAEQAKAAVGQAQGERANLAEQRQPPVDTHYAERERRPASTPHAEQGQARPVLSLSLAYSGLPSGNATQLPYGTADMNGDIDTVTHHRLPLTIALNARYRLAPRWWIDGGLRYTLLSSETRVGNTYLYMRQKQRVCYVGLSVGVGYELWQHRRWSLYATTFATCELPLRSTAETTYWQGGQLIDTEANRLMPHTQWSIGLGFGLQYSVTPVVGFFAEPSLQYYFHPSDGIKTWRTEHPFTPLLPLGVRITF